MFKKLRHRKLVLGGIPLAVAAVALAGFLGYTSIGRVTDPFPASAAGLPAASPTPVVELKDGDTFELRAGSVQKEVDGKTIKMLAYNGSVPGPTIRVTRGSRVTVTVVNNLELDTTVHWHGLRLENQYDGVPFDTQAPIPPGGSFTYHLSFPDEGVYWYHPHLREDYGQEMGLYGNIIVVPEDGYYWPPVDREEVLTLDDLLMKGGRVASFSQSSPNHTAMGRFGNVMLVNGQASYTMTARRGEVMRLYLTNTANTRVFNVRIPGAQMKLVGSDNGRYERETLVEEVLLSPSERAVVDILFDQPGELTLEHRTPSRTYALAAIMVQDNQRPGAFEAAFPALREDHGFAAERAALQRELARPADKTIALVGEMAGMGNHGASHPEGGIEWEDTMNLMNRASTPENMFWRIVDRETGQENHAIQWSFQTGSRIKIRIQNELHSDHPMQHPFHIHGQRFLVLSRGGLPNPNLAWKDTVLVPAGEAVEILLDASNPGVWMAHCHIAEHAESGMMFNFEVRDSDTPPSPTHGYGQDRHAHSSPVH